MTKNLVADFFFDCPSMPDISKVKEKILKDIVLLFIIKKRISKYEDVSYLLK